MKQIADAFFRALSVLTLPVFVACWVLYGAYTGLKVWAWNFNNSPCWDGDWKFRISDEKQ